MAIKTGEKLHNKYKFSSHLLSYGKKENYHKKKNTNDGRK